MRLGRRRGSEWLVGVGIRVREEVVAVLAGAAQVVSVVEVVRAQLSVGELLVVLVRERERRLEPRQLPLVLLHEQQRRDVLSRLQVGATRFDDEVLVARVQAVRVVLEPPALVVDAVRGGGVEDVDVGDAERLVGGPLALRLDEAPFLVRGVAE